MYSCNPLSYRGARRKFWGGLLRRPLTSVHHLRGPGVLILNFPLRTSVGFKSCPAHTLKPQSGLRIYYLVTAFGYKNVLLAQQEAVKWQVSS